MMFLVRIALRRPYTFVCVAILILIGGVVSILSTPVNVFPVIPLPVITVIWSFGGLSPEEMEQRIVTTSEQAYSATVGGIEHIESQSLSGVALVKIYMQPTADIPTGVAQVTAVSQSITRQLPPSITPPAILRFNATDVPILQIGISSATMSEANLNDYANLNIRQPLATTSGSTIPGAYGGKPRQINVDIDLGRLYAKGLSPSDVSTAINAQSLILPSGTTKLGSREYQVKLNTSPDAVSLLNELPIKRVNGAMVYVKDVAWVRDGGGVQTNMVRANGRPGTFLSVIANGDASSLAVANGVKAKLAAIRSSLTSGLDIQYVADQTIFVNASIMEVIREALIAAGLTALMILLFLGSWRGTLIIATSIPLAVLSSIICLAALGQTINVMTLSGLALAVGILVDDATVALENIDRHMQQGKDILPSVIDGSAEIATPTFVATLSITIVFLPLFFLSGAAASIFRPLAMAVVFAVLASYFLSRTIVPTMARYLLAGDAHRMAMAVAHPGEADLAPHGPIERVSARFDKLFNRFRGAYQTLLAGALAHGRITAVVAFLFVALSMLLVPHIGEDFFPATDGGSFDLHVRAPAGTRLEEMPFLFASVERSIRRQIPAADLALVLDNIGLNTGPLNLAMGSGSTVSSADGDALVQLTPTASGTTTEYVRKLRATLPGEFPGVTFSFVPADITSQILNLGLPAAIDVQVVGRDKLVDYQVASRLASQVKRVAGAVDVRVQQVVNVPELAFEIDRERAQQIGLTERDVATSLLVSLSSSGQTAPNFWLNPQNGNSYRVSVMTPQYRINTLDAINRTPVTGVAALNPPQLFGNLAASSRQNTFAVVNHYGVQPVADLYVSVDDRDLGGVAGDINQIIDKVTPTLPKGTSIVMRGQVASMRSTFIGLAFGVAFAIVLVYLLLVINFQSWLDPLVIIMALPGALAGIVWMLFVSQTTFSVPSLMGAIMTMGVATANSVLVITFADEQRKKGRSAIEAALDAGFERIRPVCMTALAMIIGMIPMALGGGQNAPLGHAVIGGLLVATCFTLVVVPVLYSILRAAPPTPPIVLPEETV
ncbi:MAG: AcrB/AcrD/AcrF family multidrug efflux protein [Gemmatimonadetes bacterium]|jgi:multidrug efflux pump subunit AcrB|nr:AcrB/AcrD/AcrF family multidrug efflux protein [Gemmatimonadota bacterium]